LFLNTLLRQKEWAQGSSS